MFIEVPKFPKSISVDFILALAVPSTTANVSDESVHVAVVGNSFKSKVIVKSSVALAAVSIPTEPNILNVLPLDIVWFAPESPAKINEDIVPVPPV